MNLIELGQKALEEKRQKEAKEISEARKVMNEFVESIKHDELVFEYYGNALRINSRNGNKFVDIKFGPDKLHCVTFHKYDYSKYMYYPEASCNKTSSHSTISLKQFAMELVEFIEHQKKYHVEDKKEFFIRNKTWW